MKVLVIGSGGREHALAWKLANSSYVDGVFAAPGNAGIAEVARCVPIGVNDFDSLVSFVEQENIDLTVVGPEEPLSKGIVDFFESRGLRIFGPSRNAAQLESSKAFAKRLMVKYGIPTATYREFSSPKDAVSYVKEVGIPIVIKADGLAAGKGVTVAKSMEEAVNAIDAAMIKGVFGDAGRKIIVEEYLSGEEASILAFTDGIHVLPMVSSQDHKPVYDGDKGPNTGGMGAYSPAPVVSDSIARQVYEKILQPVVDAMRREGFMYKGCLYAGIMVTAEGPKVVEFNCRFGDPETQAVLPRLKTDITLPLLACCNGSLSEVSLEWASEACVTVVMASGGYPGAYEKGKVIEGLEEVEKLPNTIVFHAGTSRNARGEFVTNGGRVLNVTALGATIAEAIQNAYNAVHSIHFEGAHYRTDIGQKALLRE